MGKYTNTVYFREEQLVDELSKAEMTGDTATIQTLSKELSDLNRGIIHDNDWKVNTHQAAMFDTMLRKKAEDRILETLCKIRNRIEFINIILDNTNEQGRNLIMNRLMDKEDMIDSFQNEISECMS